jgi:hypothetical protein
MMEAESLQNVGNRADPFKRLHWGGAIESVSLSSWLLNVPCFRILLGYIRAVIPSLVTTTRMIHQMEIIFMPSITSSIVKLT